MKHDPFRQFTDAVKQLLSTLPTADDRAKAAAVAHVLTLLPQVEGATLAAQPVFPFFSEETVEERLGVSRQWIYKQMRAGLWTQFYACGRAGRKYSEEQLRQNLQRVSNSQED